MIPRIRQALADDAADLGEISVLAWEAAYRGIMPDHYLDALDSEERARRWVETLSAPPPRTQVLMAEKEGRSLGFAAVGPCREDESVGELYAINLRPDAWGRGTGTALLAAATSSLRQAGFDEAILWVLPGNKRARQFYESRGWRDDGAERNEEVHDIVVTEVRYRTRL